jgi:hypothetical protein
VGRPQASRVGVRGPNGHRRRRWARPLH